MGNDTERELINSVSFYFSRGEMFLYIIYSTPLSLKKFPSAPYRPRKN